MEELTATLSVGELVGSVPFLEFSIPEEFICILSCLEKLRPQAFDIRACASAEDKRRVQNNRLYLHGHIHHDKKVH